MFNTIPNDKLFGMIGNRVHVSGFPRGAVYILKAIHGDNALLETPKTKKTLYVKKDLLLYTRADERN